MASKDFISIAEFDILELLGGGTYGRVYKAKKKNKKKAFAIKCIKLPEDDVEFALSSMREITEMRRLHHPNIVQYVTGWWETLPPSWQQNSEQIQVNASWSSQGDGFSSEAEPSIDYEKRIKMEYELWGNVSDSSPSDQLSLSVKNDGSTTESNEEVQREWIQHRRSTSQTNAALANRSNKTYLYLYIQMELCRKETLADWLKTPISQRVKLNINEIFKSILHAVQYIHKQNLIHRDLKPSNIFFSFKWSIKIGDFGLTKRMTMEETSPTSDGYQEEKRSETGTSRMNHTVYVGTKPYMAPEQELLQRYNHKVDIYALAIILFELLMGPFGSASERLIAISNLKDFNLPRKFEEDYCTDIKEMIIRMVSQNPDVRPEIVTIFKCFNLPFYRLHSTFANNMMFPPIWIQEFKGDSEYLRWERKIRSLIDKKQRSDPITYLMLGKYHDKITDIIRDKIRDEIRPYLDTPYDTIRSVFLCRENHPINKFQRLIQLREHVNNLRLKLVRNEFHKYDLETLLWEISQKTQRRQRKYTEPRTSSCKTANRQPRKNTKAFSSGHVIHQPRQRNGNAGNFARECHPKN